MKNRFLKIQTIKRRIGQLEWSEKAAFLYSDLILSRFPDAVECQRSKGMFNAYDVFNAHSWNKHGKKISLFLINLFVPGDINVSSN